ncbi:MAG: cytochrome P450 [Dehalococcoidia bacterium]|nr:cytochrome P450 [Dehalococcoidia bacterium]
MAFFDPTRPGYLANPYPALEALRRQEPVHWSANLHAWVLTRYDDCAQALHDSARFTSDPAKTTGPRADAILAYRHNMPLGETGTLGTTSGDEHRRIRQVVNPVFSPAAVRDFIPVIGEEVRAAVAGISPGEPCEFMETFANDLPRRVMHHVMGLPPGRADELQQLLATIEVTRSNPRSGSPALSAAAIAQATIALETLAAGGLPGNTVLGALALAGDAALSNDESLSIAAHVATVGTDPTSGALGNAVVALAANPGALESLRANPALLRAALHEFLRYDSPTHIAPRFASLDTEMGGRRIRRGDAVLAVVGAANRDPAAFENPDDLDVTRDARKQFAFGQGEHVCLGMHLALAVMEAALGAIIAEFRRIELLRPPAYGGSIELRIPDQVFVRFER